MSDPELKTAAPSRSNCSNRSDHVRIVRDSKPESQTERLTRQLKAIKAKLQRNPGNLALLLQAVGVYSALACEGNHISRRSRKALIRTALQECRRDPTVMLIRLGVKDGSASGPLIEASAPL
mgnify:CR=1 FL=1